MKKLNYNLDFSPIYFNTIKTKLHKNVSVIIINGGGGMGGSRETIYGTIKNKCNDMGMVVITETISGNEVIINPRYIGTIRTTNISSVYCEHGNNNYPSKKRTVWVLHPIDTELNVYKDNCSNKSHYDTSILMTNNYTE
jgi:hypothetical protein